MKKYLYIGMGFLTFGLGTVGIFLPFLPTTVFYLLTGFFWVHSSDRLHQQFIESEKYKQYIEDPLVKKEHHEPRNDPDVRDDALCLCNPFCADRQRIVAHRTDNRILGPPDRIDLAFAVQKITTITSILHRQIRACQQFRIIAYHFPHGPPPRVIDSK